MKQRQPRRGGSVQQRAAAGAGAGAAAAGGRQAKAAPSNVPLDVRLVDGEHSAWTVLVATAALLPGLGDAPLASASADAVAALGRLAQTCRELILVHRLSSATEEGRKAEKAAVTAWASQHLASKGLKRDSLLFTTTTKGVEAIARQTVPGLYLGADPALCDFLSGFLPHVVCVGAAAPPTKPKVTVAPAIDSLPL
jgi:hypothetical protein